jgi:aerobic-type carbon monoxide dehydrogenase small subunit (CoxS/CutS family)
MVKINLKVNGKSYTHEVADNLLLIDYIRDVIGLKGTHRGCDTGHCGACTVLMNGEPVKSCQILAAQADGSEITTVEGLEQDGKLSLEQQAFIDNHAAQCGFCTPGFLMMTHYLITNIDHEMSDEEIKDYIHGNYCMCTGYKPIINAIKDAQKRYFEIKKKDIPK